MDGKKANKNVMQFSFTLSQKTHFRPLGFILVRLKMYVTKQLRHNVDLLTYSRGELFMDFLFLFMDDLPH